MVEIIKFVANNWVPLVAVFMFLFTGRYTVAYWKMSARGKLIKGETDLIEELKQDIQNLTRDYLKELETVRQLSSQLRDFERISVQVETLLSEKKALMEVIDECERCKKRLEEKITQLGTMRKRVEGEET